MSFAALISMLMKKMSFLNGSHHACRVAKYKFEIILHAHERLIRTANMDIIHVFSVL